MNIVSRCIVSGIFAATHYYQICSQFKLFFNIHYDRDCCSDCEYFEYVEEHQIHDIKCGWKS